MTTMVILGVDPGLRYTGYAVAEVEITARRISKVRALGAFETKPTKLLKVRKTSDHLNRAQAHAGHLLGLVKRYGVSAIAIELTTLTQYKIPTLSFGIMTGIIATLQHPVIEVLPKEVKMFAGEGKRDVIAWALARTRRQRNLAWPTSSRQNAYGLQYQGKNVTKAAEHPADALATIQAALQTTQFELGARLAAVGSSL